GGYGNCGGGDYYCSFVHSGEKVGQYASLALDSADQPNIAYYDGTNGTLLFAVYNYTFDDWTIDQIRVGSAEHPAGQYASLAIDVNHGDMPHIAYLSDYDTLEYAYYVGHDGNCGLNGIMVYTWQCDEIDFMGSSTHPKGISLALDEAGFPIIAYQFGDSILKIARPVEALDKLIGNCGPATPNYTWQCDVISIGFGIGQGDYMSLAINDSGLSTIAYFGTIDPSGGDLNIAYQQFQVFLPLTLNN
nr:hypothetical protein [candidate division Zixibacteria bacterium]NIR96378.1 hypothetical protein [Gammaproteobacteria bacterium]NIS48086.1 hypothetical protein [candidate division Zixibacteria bacterium]NIV08340.1 hypothetical protein [candidate division Zixibacteria bacterium]NIW48001.1 hypothetical protein [Gammaproteobacteria bacterium]